MSKHEISGIFSKRQIIRIFAAFFVLYMLFDVTLAQNYCCDETGPGDNPTVHQLAGKQGAPIPVDSIDTTSVDNPPDQNQSPELPKSDDDCFCHFSYVLFDIRFPESSSSPVIAKLTDDNFIPKSASSDTHLQAFYHPPRIA